jgi:hypothetical protein
MEWEWNGGKEAEKGWEWWNMMKWYSMIKSISFRIFQNICKLYKEAMWLDVIGQIKTRSPARWPSLLCTETASCPAPLWVYFCCVLAINLAQRSLKSVASPVFTRKLVAQIWVVDTLVSLQPHPQNLELWKPMLEAGISIWRSIDRGITASSAASAIWLTGVAAYRFRNVNNDTLKTSAVTLPHLKTSLTALAAPKSQVFKSRHLAT